MPTHIFEFSLLSFTSLITVINPLGIIPLYIAMTAGVSAADSRKIALKATLTAATLMVMFALAGKFVFEFFSISVESLRVVGGIIFTLVGYEMLQARLSRTKHSDETTAEYADDIAITPLAIPMICGPGAITTVMILMNDSNTLLHRGALFAVITAVAVLTFVSLVGGKTIMSTLGDSGSKVLMRLMGLILMVTGVEFFFSGLSAILRNIFQITG